jgi:hypothetical protein
VFIRFAACAIGLTPSFAGGPFDALNAVSTSRVRDAYELQLIARGDLDVDRSGLPLPVADPVLGNSGAASALRRNAAQDAVFGGYSSLGHAGGSGGLAPSPEHPPLIDRSAVFLARVFIPVGAVNPPTRSADAPLVDNYARRFLPSAALLAQWAGF